MPYIRLLTDEKPYFVSNEVEEWLTKIRNPNEKNRETLFEQLKTSSVGRLYHEFFQHIIRYRKENRENLSDKDKEAIAHDIIRSIQFTVGIENESPYNLYPQERILNDKDLKTFAEEIGRLDTETQNIIFTSEDILKIPHFTLYEAFYEKVFEANKNFSNALHTILKNQNEIFYSALVNNYRGNNRERLIRNMRYLKQLINSDTYTSYTKEQILQDCLPGPKFYRPFIKKLKEDPGCFLDFVLQFDGLTPFKDLSVFKSFKESFCNLIKEYITSKEDKAYGIMCLHKALNPEMALGSIFYEQTGLQPTSLERGTLHQVWKQALNLIFPQLIDPDRKFSDDKYVKNQFEQLLKQFVDDKGQLKRNMFPKDAVYDYIKEERNPIMKKKYVAAALNPNTELGKLFRIQRGHFFIDESRGTLGKLYQLAQKLGVDSSYSAPLTSNITDSDLRLESAPEHSDSEGFALQPMTQKPPSK